MAKKKAEKAEKHPGGRPTTYDPIYCEMLVKHMEDGFSFESFGKIAKCARSTLYEWEKNFEEFSDAKKLGETACQYFWEEQGIRYLHNETIKDGDGMTVTRSINATLWIFNMKNRFGWRDKQKDEEEQPKGQPGMQLSADQLIDIIKKAR